jgi:branched-chain amino acid transport system substrate-binding protein
MLFGGTNSGTGLAMAKVAQEKKRVFMVNGAGASQLTNEQCSPYTVHYAYDTVALAKGTGGAVVENGGKSWFFLTADYAFGAALEADTAKVVKEKGGTVVGGVKHPLNASDFSSFLLQAQNSKAQILGLANAGGDTINAIKAAKEFGVTKTMKMAGLLVFITDIHSLGLKNTEGLLLTTSWDWNLNEQTRAFGNKFFDKMKRMPTDIQAADYSATMTYLKAVQNAKSTDADKVMAELKKMPINDFYAKGQIRGDGRFVHDMYLVQVKSPAESTKPWDYYKVVAKLPGEEVFTTKAESKCAVWKQ